MTDVYIIIKCVCVCVRATSGQLWRVIKQTATVISSLLFRFVWCEKGRGSKERERDRKTADKIWPSASEYIKHRQVSISVGEEDRRRSRSSCDKNVTVSATKPKDLRYFTLISQVRKIFKTPSQHPLALYHHFSLSLLFFWSRLVFFHSFFFWNGLWWSFVYVRLSSSNICFRDR